MGKGRDDNQCSVLSFALNDWSITLSFRTTYELNTQQLSLGFCGSLLPRPLRYTYGRVGWVKEKYFYNRDTRASSLESQ